VYIKAAEVLTINPQALSIQPKTKDISKTVKSATQELMMFSPKLGVNIVNLDMLGWKGEIWLDGTSISFQCRKFFPGLSQDKVANRIWSRKDYPSNKLTTILFVKVVIYLNIPLDFEFITIRYCVETCCH